MSNFVAETRVHLTERERSVFQLLVRGKNYREIADSLLIAPNTAREYMSRVYRKLAVSSRSQLIEQALKLGVLEINFL